MFSDFLNFLLINSVTLLSFSYCFLQLFLILFHYKRFCMDIMEKIKNFEEIVKQNYLYLAATLRALEKNGILDDAQIRKELENLKRKVSDLTAKGK